MSPKLDEQHSMIIMQNETDATEARGSQDGLIAQQRDHNEVDLNEKIVKHLKRTLTQDLPKAMIILLSLFGIGLLLAMFGEVEQYDYSKVDYSALPPFNVSQLQPFDAQLGQNYNIVLETHAHTLYSDGHLEVKQVLQWAISNGFNALALSDHNVDSGYSEAVKIIGESDDNMLKDLIIVPAMEYSSCRIHMNIYGVLFSEVTDPLYVDYNKTTAEFMKKLFRSPYPSDDQLTQFIGYVHQFGGVVSVNHIPWSTRVSLSFGNYHPALIEHPTLEKLQQWGIDVIEAVNGDTLDLPSIQYAQNSGIGHISGNDLHLPGPSYSWTVMQAQNKSWQAIVETMKQRKSTFLFDARGSYMQLTEAQMQMLEPAYNPRYMFLLPLIAVGQYLGIFFTQKSGMTSFQGPRCYDNDTLVNTQVVGFWFLWLVLLFVLYEGIMVLWIAVKFQYRRRKEHSV